MPWPLKFITIGTQCAACQRVYPLHVQTAAAPHFTCADGCVVVRGLIWRTVDMATGEKPVVGDAFYRPDYLEPPYRMELSPKYHAQHAGTRPPICVVLPSGQWWVVDCYAYNHNGPHGEGWDVSGDIQPGAPTLSCSPSINCVGYYHGYVTAGTITNDCEGRQFNAAGL